MKIIFFNYLPLEYGGGLAKYYRVTAMELKKRYPALSISIVTLDDRFARKIQRLYSLYFMKPPIQKNEKKALIISQLGKITYEQARNLTELKKLVNSADLLYSKNDIVEASILKFLLRYASLPPVILGFHTPLYYESTPSLQAKLHNVLYTSFLYRFLIKPAAKYHVLNSFDEALLKKHFSNKKVIKIYNPFSFPQSTTQRKLPHKKKLTILWAGRLTEQKGVIDLIHLIEEINQTKYRDDIIWKIAGDGELKSSVMTLAKKWRNVHYLGHIASGSMATVYRSSDLFISTSKWESLPYTLLEATSNALPVIAYNIHGNDEIITKNTGILVSTSEEFVDTILAMVRKHSFLIPSVDPSLRKKFSPEIIYPKLYTELFRAI